MRKYTPKEPNINDILNLLCSLDKDLLRSIREQGTPIVIVTAAPVSPVRDDDEDDKDVCDEDEEYAEDELEDEEDCDCPEYEPSMGGAGRCIYSCPECGFCLREHIGEEFE